MSIALVVWLAIAVAAIVGIALANRRSRKIDSNAEAVYSSGLSRIVEVADRQHVKKYGRPASELRPIKMRRR